MCTTAFYTPGNLADAIQIFQRATFGGRATAFVKGVRVQTTHLGYKKTVKAVSNKTARTHRFKVDEYNNQEMTVEQYFQRSETCSSFDFESFLCSHVPLSEYRTTLKFPDLQLVDVGGAKQNLLPAELCIILPNQAFKGKLTDDQTAQMIKVAAKPPNINAQAIVNQGIKELGFLNDSVQLNTFGVQVSSDMVVVPARRLPNPDVHYATGKAQVDDKASWNLRSVKFTRGARLDNWAVLVIRDGGRDDFERPDDPGLQAIYRGLAQMCKQSGMQVGAGDPRIIAANLPRKDSANDPTRQAAITVIENMLKKSGSKPSIVLVILSSGDKHIYSGIKKLCDTVLDLRMLTSSCILTEWILTGWVSNRLCAGAEDSEREG